MTEHEKARAWRQGHGFTLSDLGELIGYSVESISCMERGLTPARPPKNGRKDADRTIKPWVWRRYKMACAGAQAELQSKQAFDW